LEERELILEIPAEFPHHLADVPELARRFPEMTIVIDHLAKPPIGGAAMVNWAEQLHAAAAAPNVTAKVSGLNTAVKRRDWNRQDFEPAIRIAVDAFGPRRLIWGSDWPVSLLNGTYDAVWRETLAALETVTPYDADGILSANARRLYRIDGDDS
jgi:L-fuconolactonase